MKFEALMARGGICQYSSACYNGNWMGVKTPVFDTSGVCSLVYQESLVYILFFVYIFSFQGRVTLTRMEEAWAKVDMWNLV